MERAEAKRQLDEYLEREEMIRRKFIVPTLLLLAVAAFAIILLSGFEGSWTTLLPLAIVLYCTIYIGRLDRVRLSRPQKRKLYWTVFGAFVWAIICNAYFVYWNPQGIPAGAVVGAIVASFPLLLLARYYRP